MQGAIRAYEFLPEWNPVSLQDLLAAHAALMGDVLKEASIFRRAGFVAFMLEAIEKVLVGNEATTQETTQETTLEKFLRHLRRPASTRKELTRAVGITPDGVKYHLDKLRKAGVIRHVGSTKAGHWEVAE
ncbi:helix-turn-helix domain-containing protein [Kiritimatiellaeota bacterium B1221]|nr:helix-turn-helix domain-containing protein [Kiritimatiellaeota bacterium B1221]